MEKGKSAKGQGTGKTSKSSNAKTTQSNKASSSMGKKDSNSLLKQFFVEQLQDIYWAEKALVQELPKIQGATSTEELAEAITEHGIGLVEILAARQAVVIVDSKTIPAESGQSL